MHRLRTWTRGHIEILRAWQRYTARHFADWPRLTALYTQLKALPTIQQTHWRRRCKATLWGVALCLAASGVQPVLADTITVDGAICTLVNAITTANSDIDTGGCVQTGTVSAADTIVLTVDTTLTTANNSTFGATGLPVISSAITITGNGHTIERDPGDPDVFRLIAINSAGNLTLQDTTLSGGVAAGAPPSNWGGGILNYSGQLRLEGCTVSGNSAGKYGGGVYSFANGSDAVSIIDSTLSSNSAGYCGGGVFSGTVGTSMVILINSTVSGNSASNHGGGVYSRTAGSGTLSLINSTVTGNAAGKDGGGIYSGTRESSTLSIIDSTVTGNAAEFGGGVHSFTNDSGALSIINSTLSDNVAEFGGGMRSRTNGTSTLSIINSTVSGIAAGEDGGGVNSYTGHSSTISLVNSTLSGNVAGEDGGGIYSRTDDSGTLSVVNSTLSGNTAYESGGGMFSFTDDSGTVTLHRSLIAGNTATSIGDEVRRYNSGGSFLVDDANLFGHSGVSTGVALFRVSAGASDILATSDSAFPTVLADILDTLLANNGGPTLTHALPTGSPAIDAAGDCSPLGTDQRGVARPQGLACDIGAFELSEAVSETCGNCVDDDGDGLVDFADPDCPATTMTKERASFSLNAPVQTDQLILTATLPGGGLVNPLLDGVNVQFVDSSGALLCLALPPAATAPGAWSTKVSGTGKTTWTFKDAADGHLGAPSKDKGSVAYDPNKNTTTVKLTIKQTEIGGSATARDISTAVTIGPSTWQKVQAWQPKAKGKKLGTP